VSIEDFLVDDKPKEVPILRDNYYKMILTQGDTIFVICSPGHKMKSWLAFHKKLGYDVKYENCTKEDYEIYLWGTKL